MLHNILVLKNLLAWISSSFFQALKDKGERGLLQYRPTKG
jgi:hypothetical protein